ncbi:hypothetical protein ABZ128_12955 [Streptomyces sp. NPDC006326]|uniref:hypothetical protein n=1 Tax=Streptomyces sp. NPDC006326 TaxID=3156752 RepID=UPI0033B70131
MRKPNAIHIAAVVVAGGLLAVTACTAKSSDAGTDKPASATPSAGSPQPSGTSSGGATPSAWSGAYMPKLVSTSLKHAREALPPGTAVEVKDLSPQGRTPSTEAEADWRVCFQSPPASIPLDASHPVTLSVLKSDENCLQPPG